MLDNIKLGTLVPFVSYKESIESVTLCVILGTPHPICYVTYGPNKARVFAHVAFQALSYVGF